MSSNCFGAFCRSSKILCNCSSVKFSANRTHFSYFGLYISFKFSSRLIAPFSSKLFINGKLVFTPVILGSSEIRVFILSLIRSSNNLSFSDIGILFPGSSLKIRLVSLSNFKPDGRAALYTSPIVHI